MKNTKAVFLIILGSFLLATGFAYAEQESALEQLKAMDRSVQPALVLDAAGFGGNKSALTTTTKGVDLTSITKSTAPAVPAVSAAAPAAKQPTTFSKFQEFWNKKGGMQMILSAVVIGFLGFLTLGTAGAGLLVGAAAFGFFYALNNI